MRAVTWWAYYYGTLAVFLFVAEIIVVRETGEMFNPMNQPYITFPLMLLTAFLMVVPSVYYMFIKPQLRWEELKREEEEKTS